jgi:L-alanine-DL-glutamate epimerase-like enolase superfamily enzyme
VRVVSVDATVVAVPFRPEVGAVVTAGMVLTEARHVLIEVRTDEGVTGLGEAVPRPSVYGETVDSILAALRDLLVPPILGLDPLDTEKPWQRWRRVMGNTTAKAALDMALHDIAGRVAGQPLYKLLGGWSDGRVRLAMPIAITDDDSVREQAEKAVAGGYAAIKMKVGKDVPRDVRTVELVRETVGPEPLLYVDANQGYSTRDALVAIGEFERLGVELFEEPVAPANVDGRVKLSRRGTVALLLDETIQDASDALREIALGTPGAFSIRSPRSGITQSRKLTGIAEAAGVPCLAGSHRELGVGTAASAHLAAAFACMSYPAELGVHTLLTDSLLADPLRIENGWLSLPAGPGLGVELDPERVERHRVAEVLTVG